ncbi:Uncharacterised protein [Chlamydia trachomatis]|nr:Uncharacterised protein [Chlamydia trachomatis]
MASTNLADAFCLLGRTLLDLLSIFERTNKYNRHPIATIKPILHSNAKIIIVNIIVFIKPDNVFTITIAAVFSTSSKTVVEIPTTSPILFSLKNPIGIFFNISPIATLLFATIK